MANAMTHPMMDQPKKELITAIDPIFTTLRDTPMIVGSQTGLNWSSQRARLVAQMVS
jgi:hypothetical protein